MAHPANLNQHMQTSTMTAEQFTDALWNVRSPAIKSGISSSLVFDLRLKARLGPGGVAELKRRYETLIEAPVTVLEDFSANHLKLEPSNAPSGNAHQIQQTHIPLGATKAEKVARPPNAFILYRKHHHDRIKHSEPNIHNNEISKRLGTAWANAPIEEKTHFRQLANLLKERHMREHPNYVYQPRKPGEKKRRMTRRKKEALAAAMSVQTDLPRNTHGNIVLEFGGGQSEIANLHSKIEMHNSDLAPISHLHNEFIRTVAPDSIYCDRTQDHQSQISFLEEMLGGGTIDPTLLSQSTSSPAPILSSSIPDFYQNQATNFTAEVIRMQNFFD